MYRETGIKGIERKMAKGYRKENGKNHGTAILFRAQGFSVGSVYLYIYIHISVCVCVEICVYAYILLEEWKIKWKIKRKLGVCMASIRILHPLP